MIGEANLEDIPQLLRLINSCYRGEESKKGWTTEALLIEGEVRTDSSDLVDLINAEDGCILKYTSENTIIGCVNLQKQGEKIYLGMFSVNPDFQGAGIGKKILFAADEFAIQKSCKAIKMKVISERHELVSWYIKYGFHPTGEELPFPKDNKFGKPLKELKFIVLEKKLK